MALKFHLVVPNGVSNEYIDTEVSQKLGHISKKL